MRDAKDWADEFCRKHIINSRGYPVRELVEAVQKDARAEFLIQDALMKRYPPLKAE